MERNLSPFGCGLGEEKKKGRKVWYRNKNSNRRDEEVRTRRKTERKSVGKKKVSRQCERQRSPSHVVRTSDKPGDIPGEVVSMASGY